VRFSEPIDPDSVTASSFNLSGPAGSVAAALRVSPDRRSATLTPVAPLVSATDYEVTLSEAVTDLAGNPLTPFGPSAFRTLDTSFTRDVTGLIRAEAPDANGFLTVRGGPGTAEPGQAVGVINQTTGVIVTAVAASDGSFEIRIPGTTADLLSVNLRTAAGTDTEVPIAAYQNPDGSVTLGELGGQVSVDTPDGPLVLDVPAGALTGLATIKLTPVSKTDLLAELAALGLPLPDDPAEGPVFGGALRIEAGGAEAVQSLDLSVPLPQSVVDLALAAGRTVEDIGGTLARVEAFSEVEGVVENGFREIDSIKAIDGRLDTSSAPFAGIGGTSAHPAIVRIAVPIGGLYIFFPFPTATATVVNGRVLIADNPAETTLVEPPPGEPCPNLETSEPEKCPATGAVARITGSSTLFYAIADVLGHYAGTAPLPAGSFIAVAARRTDSEPAVRSVQVLSQITSVPEIVLKRIPPPPDETPPTVRILASATSPPAGTNVVLSVFATDNDQSPANVQALE
jgi:hypothetical protein